MSNPQQRNTARIVLPIFATIVMIVCLGFLFLTDLPAWPIFIVAVVVLVPCQIVIAKMKDQR